MSVEFALVDLRSELETLGFARVRKVFTSEEVQALQNVVPNLDDAAGTRNLLSFDWGERLAHSSKLMAIVNEVFCAPAIPVRGILFDKSPSSNWTLGWHQDTKICVKTQAEIEGFTAWSVKEGVVHCQPPVEVLQAMVAMRLHLDPCGAGNGPLRVIPGSHLGGFWPAGKPIDTSNEQPCVADIGDIVLMKPLLLHASSKSKNPVHRRVIHIEYCSASLPEELSWQYA